MKKGNKATLTVTLDSYGSKETFADCLYLGCGQYCKAYRIAEGKHSGRVLLITKEDDYTKEIAAAVSGHSVHLPKIELLSVWHCDRGGEKKVYIMDYYPDVTAKDSLAWQQFRALDNAWDEAHAHYRKLSFSNRAPMYSYGYEIACYTLELAHNDISETLREAIQLLIDSASAYGVDYCLEYAKRNLGVSANGELIFRDSVFSMEKVHNNYHRLTAQEETRRECIKW